MSRQVTGTLRAPDGTVVPNATIVVVSDRSEETTEVIRGSFYVFSTNGAGFYDVTLVNGFYRVYREITGGQLHMGYILVETDVAISLTDLLALNEQPTYPGINALAFQVQAAQAHADDAEAALAAIEALLTGSPPVILTHPQTQNVNEGDNILFSASAYNYSAVQWYRNGQMIAGETGTTYSLQAGAINDGDIFFARFTNGAGSIDSLHATLNVNKAPVVNNQNVDAVVGIGVFIVLGPPTDADGDAVTYTVTPAGDFTQSGNTIVYTPPGAGQVQLNVEADDGQLQTNATLTIDAVAAENYENNLITNNIVVQ